MSYFHYNGTATTTYANDYYNTEGATTTKHIYASGSLIATIEKTPATSTPALHIIHSDHLGGTSAITNQKGLLEESITYRPFGSARVDQTYSAFNESRKYIGEEYDSGTGLSYLNARYYDGGRGQFLSQDSSFLDIGAAGFEEKYERTLQMHLMNPQALNSYSYGLNNPITNVDPEGEIVPLIIGAWALAEVGLSAYDIYSTGSTLFDDNASLGEKVTSGGLTIAGFALPGGGYGVAGKQIFKQTNSAGQALMKGVKNHKVMNLIRDNYRTIKGDLIGSGSAVDAMLHTLKTGNFVGGSNHIDKIKQNVKRINNILHDRNIKLNSAETKAINKILQDSKKALNKLKK